MKDETTYSLGAGDPSTPNIDWVRAQAAIDRDDAEKANGRPPKLLPHNLTIIDGGKV